MEIEKAFGQNGLGLILVKGYPDLQKNRKRVLNVIREFGNLPEEVRESYSDPKSFFSVGWSHGKEIMKGGKPDLAKGSYYGCPILDIKTNDQKLKIDKEQVDEFINSNVPMKRFGLPEEVVDERLLPRRRRRRAHLFLHAARLFAFG